MSTCSLGHLNCSSKNFHVALSTCAQGLLKTYGSGIRKRIGQSAYLPFLCHLETCPKKGNDFMTTIKYTFENYKIFSTADISINYNITLL